jgi:protein-L-isoaspartate(D-aspartate) O-methyltransferase
MNQEQARINMIKQQVRTWEVTDSRIIDLMNKYPREDFVPEAWRELAYSDTNIQIDDNNCALFPGLEARMLQALDVQPGEQVLEIGTGCGYMTALLNDLSGNVLSLDNADHVQQAANKLLEGVVLDKGNANEGWQERDNFDVIVLNGSVQELPEGLLEKLNPGGRMFAVIGEAPAMAATLITRNINGLVSSEQLFETSLPRVIAAEEKDIFNF